MIRAPKLVVSRPMYAFDPATFGNPYDSDGPCGGSRTVDAVWFRRKNGRLVAAMGSYRLHANWGRWDGDAARPADTYEAWVAQHDDNRYGGGHLASWDGEALLCSDQRMTPAEAARRVEFLTLMLARYPDPPAGWDGWWTFPKADAR